MAYRALHERREGNAPVLIAIDIPQCLEDFGKLCRVDSSTVQTSWETPDKLRKALS